ncbi:MAG: MotA/TolQ/ExbB proton channel family protein [Phycisphaeraceae bacterium]
MYFTLAQAGDTSKDTLKDTAAKAAAKDSAKDAAKTGEAKGGEAKAAEVKPETVATTGQSDDAWYHQGAIGMMVKGGFFMWPILILGILGAGVIIERYRSLRMLRTDTEGMRNQVRDMLHNDRPEEALEMVDKEQGPVPAILGAGLRKYVVLRRLGHDAERIDQQVIKTMEDYAVHVVAALERHLPILATIASVAPMIGFLGTVQGMIFSFNDIEAGIGKENIVKLAAGGIKIALLTTCFGLIVGIPAFAAYNYFTGVVNRFVLDVEESATELIETVTLQSVLEAHEESGGDGQVRPTPKAVGVT